MTIPPCPLCETTTVNASFEVTWTARVTDGGDEPDALKPAGTNGLPLYITCANPACEVDRVDIDEAELWRMIEKGRSDLVNGAW